MDGLEGIVSELGVRSVGEIGSPGQYGWDEIIDSSATLSAAANVEKTFQISNEFAVCVQELAFEVWNPSAYATNVIAGTPAYPLSNGQTGSAIQAYMSRAHFRVQISNGSYNFFSAAQRVSLCAGTVVHPAILGTRRWLAPGTNGKVTVYNDSPVDVAWQLVLKGFRLRANLLK